MNTNTMAHANDPETSHVAARRVSRRRSALLRRAIVEMLAEEPRTDDELIAAYSNLAGVNNWPTLPHQHEVKRRRSDMRTRFHVVKPLVIDGVNITRPSADNNPSTVWTLAVDADMALRVVSGE